MSHNQARRDDRTKCPKHTEGIITGILESPNTTGNNRDAARIGDWAVCKTGDLDVIVEGAATCTIGGRHASRVGNKLWHGGRVDAGSSNIVIGGPTITANEVIAAAKARALKNLRCARKRLERWSDDDKALFRKWFGSDSDSDRDNILSRIEANKTALKDATFRMGPEDTVSDNANDPNVFAHVYQSDSDHNVYLDPHFWRSGLGGTDNQAGTLLHEMSHFNDVGGTKDHVYGQKNAAELALSNPAKAIENADNYEYFMEDVQVSCP